MRLACQQHCKREFLDMKGNADADKILTLANQLYQNEHKHKIGEDGWTAPHRDRHQPKDRRGRDVYAT